MIHERVKIEDRCAAEVRSDTARRCFRRGGLGPHGELCAQHARMLTRGWTLEEILGGNLGIPLTRKGGEACSG